MTNPRRTDSRQPLELVEDGVASSFPFGDGASQVVGWCLEGGQRSRLCEPAVSTIVMGQAASAAAVLALSGTKGKRYALPHARILLHQPYGGAEGQAVDIEIQAKEIVRNRELMNEIIANHTGQPLESVSKDTDRDFILTAEQAQEYGAVDEIITSRKTGPELAVAAAGAS